MEFFPHHSYLTISLVVWGGIYGFFVIERLLKIFMEVKNGKQVSLELLETGKKLRYFLFLQGGRLAKKSGGSANGSIEQDGQQGGGGLKDDDQGTTEPILQKNGEGKVDGEDEDGGTRVSFREQGCAGVGNAEVGK